MYWSRYMILSSGSIQTNIGGDPSKRIHAPLLPETNQNKKSFYKLPQQNQTITPNATRLFSLRVMLISMGEK